MSTFIKLLKKFILLAIPLVMVCIYTFLNPMGYMSVEYPMWIEERDMVHKSSGSSDPGTIVIGDSRAKSGIIPGEIKDGGEIYNIAIGGSTGIEMYFALRNYLKNHKAPERALVIFAPFHFTEMDNWDQTLYYNYLTAAEVLEVKRDALKYGTGKVNYNGSLADLLSFALRLPNKYMDALITSRFNGNREANLKKYAAVRSEYGYTGFGEEDYNDGLSYETHKEDFELNLLVDEYYLKLLDLLKEAGTEVIIEQAPLNTASHKAIKDEYFEAYDKYMEGISESYPSFSVVIGVPEYDNSYFGDNNHLNRRGAERFSREIKERWFGE